jgi:hypothetical protein
MAWIIGSLLIYIENKDRRHISSPLSGTINSKMTCVCNVCMHIYIYSELLQANVTHPSLIAEKFRARGLIKAGDEILLSQIH